MKTVEWCARCVVVWCPCLRFRVEVSGLRCRIWDARLSGLRLISHTLV